LVEAEPDVRRAILSALGSFRDEGSGALIVCVLGGMETDRALRAEASTAAELVGGDNVAKALEKCLRTEPLDADLKIAAVIVLGRLRYVSALPDLEAIAANEDEKARQPALDAVATIGGGAGRKHSKGWRIMPRRMYAEAR
jgi:HEAT repeat protein